MVLDLQMMEELGYGMSLITGSGKDTEEAHEIGSELKRKVKSKEVCSQVMKNLL